MIVFNLIKAYEKEETKINFTVQQFGDNRFETKRSVTVKVIAHIIQLMCLKAFSITSVSIGYFYQAFQQALHKMGGMATAYML